MMLTMLFFSALSWAPLTVFFNKSKGIRLACHTLLNTTKRILGVHPWCLFSHNILLVMPNIVVQIVTTVKNAIMWKYAFPNVWYIGVISMLMEFVSISMNCFDPIGSSLVDELNDGLPVFLIAICDRRVSL